MAARSHGLHKVQRFRTLTRAITFICSLLQSINACSDKLIYDYSGGEGALEPARPETLCVCVCVGVKH